MKSRDERKCVSSNTFEPADKFTCKKISVLCLASPYPVLGALKFNYIFSIKTTTDYKQIIVKRKDVSFAQFGEGRQKFANFEFIKYK